MKPTITISYTKICEAIRQNQGRTALMVNSDGDAVLVEANQFKPAHHAMVDLPASPHAESAAVNLINEMNGHGADAWRGQRIYGQSPTSMFLFEYDFSQ